MSTEFLDAAQAAEMLNLKNKRAVLNAWNSGQIPGTKINNRYIVSRKQLIEHIEKISLNNYREPINYGNSNYYMRVAKRKKVKRMG